VINPLFFPKCFYFLKQKIDDFLQKNIAPKAPFCAEGECRVNPEVTWADIIQYLMDVFYTRNGVQDISPQIKELFALKKIVSENITCSKNIYDARSKGGK
jgi:hypothetical protein